MSKLSAGLIIAIELMEECFKWAVIAASYYEEIGLNPECILKLRKYDNNHNWSRLEFPVAINKIDEFEKNDNDIVVYV